MTKSRWFLGLVGLFATTATRCGGAPSTAPDKSVTPSIAVVCDATTGPALNCRAPVTCGASPCAVTTPADVTGTATWSIDDNSVVHMVAAGTFVGNATSASGNYTAVRAQAPGMQSGCATVAVFPAIASPLPTFTLVGNVYSGSDRTAGAIKGAFVEVTSGLIAGDVALTGSSFPCSICCTPPTTPAPGTFLLNAVPPGTIHLHIQAAGYQILERDVTFTFSSGSVSMDFQLQPN